MQHSVYTDMQYNNWLSSLILIYKDKSASRIMLEEIDEGGIYFMLVDFIEIYVPTYPRSDYILISDKEFVTYGIYCCVGQFKSVCI